MSNSDKHIEKVIKDSFDGEQKRAPEGLWANIDQAANLSTDEYEIRESFDNHIKSAPSKTWNNLKRQLIIDDVWDNIVVHEDRRKRKFIWWFFGAASFILILFSLSIFNFQSYKNIVELTENNNEADNAIINEIVKKGNQDTSNSKQNESGIPESYLITSNSLTSDIENHEKTVEVNSVEADLKSTTSIDNNEITSNTSKNNFDKEPVVSIVIQDSNIIPQVIIERITPKEIQSISIDFLLPTLITDFDTFPKPKTTRLEVGIIGSIGNSWVFNNDVKNGLNRNSLILNNLSAGYSIGGLLVYNFNNKSGLELEYDFYSVHNQGYDFYNEGRLIHKDIRLKQQKISLDYKMRFINSPYRKRVFLIKSGLFLSHSIKEQTSINWVGNAANSSFSTFDFGLNLGAGIEQRISQFKVEYGVKTDVGLRNITANSISFPKKFNYTSTYILSGYISFRYVF